MNKHLLESNAKRHCKQVDSKLCSISPAHTTTKNFNLTNVNNGEP